MNSKNLEKFNNRHIPTKLPSKPKVQKMSLQELMARDPNFDINNLDDLRRLREIENQSQKSQNSRATVQTQGESVPSVRDPMQIMN